MNLPIQARYATNVQYPSALPATTLVTRCPSEFFPHPIRSPQAVIEAMLDLALIVGFLGVIGLPITITIRLAFLS